MTEHVWRPDPVTRLAGERASVRYQGAEPVAAGEQKTPSPALVALKEEIVRAWPGVYEGGMVRPSDRRENAGTDPHRAGIAVDFMIRDDGSRVANGDALANWLVRNAQNLGLQYVLWSRYEWASSPGARWEAYTGTNPHVDHVHVELGPDARQWPAEAMRARVKLLLAPKSNTGRNVAIVGTGVVAAGLWWWLG